MEKFNIKLELSGSAYEIVEALKEYADVVQEAIDGEHTNAVLDGAEWGEDENGKFEVTITNV